MIHGLMESGRLAVESLRSNTMRSLLTTLGIVIGISTVIAIISVIQGLNRAFAAQISGMGSDVIYVQKWNWTSNDWTQLRKWKDIGFKELHAIQRSSHLVDKVAPMFVTMRKVKNGRRYIDEATVYGFGVGGPEIRGAVPMAGRALTPVDFDGSREVVLIGWDIAEKLFPHESPVGKPLTVGGKRLQIVGVLEKKGNAFGESLDATVIMPIGTFMKHFGRRRMMTITVVPKANADPDETIDELRGILRRVRKVPFGQPDTFGINRIDALQELYRTLTGGLYAAMIGVGSISLLVGGGGIMNIMLVSVTERTKEIGIRKALGARPRAILLQFLLEAIVLSCLGGVLGTWLGFGIAALVDAVSPVPASVQPWSIGIGLGFSATVGLVFGVLPARRAAAKNPIDCLRYE